jgi:hypothetical protein
MAVDIMMTITDSISNRILVFTERVTLEKLTVAHLIKTLFFLMELEYSLPHSEERISNRKRCSRIKT